jgi:hypothetical protein
MLVVNVDTIVASETMYKVMVYGWYINHVSRGEHYVLHAPSWRDSTAEGRRELEHVLYRLYSLCLGAGAPRHQSFVVGVWARTQMAFFQCLD